MLGSNSPIRSQGMERCWKHKRKGTRDKEEVMVEEGKVELIALRVHQVMLQGHYRRGHSCHRVNAVSVLCKRTIEEVKNEMARCTVSGEEESCRLKQSSKTGGGPAPDVYFKQWELIVLMHFLNFKILTFWILQARFYVAAHRMHCLH
ncbi:uncharacterized protein LOC121382004 [Gigantopelta aegis]|uniref:uncharacterized protein LOC121382004 n=1 Tax=Gigantopelta aegis TaxID=1735272 RepID=UPI001B88C7F0|nr:uncharacterized protein LOC121382004 [Gigantopelta aegis]